MSYGDRLGRRRRIRPRHCHAQRPCQTAPCQARRQCLQTEFNPPARRGPSIHSDPRDDHRASRRPARPPGPRSCHHVGGERGTVWREHAGRVSHSSCSYRSERSRWTCPKPAPVPEPSSQPRCLTTLAPAHAATCCAPRCSIGARSPSSPCVLLPRAATGRSPVRSCRAVAWRCSRTRDSGRGRARCAGPSRAWRVATETERLRHHAVRRRWRCDPGGRYARNPFRHCGARQTVAVSRWRLSRRATAVPYLPALRAARRRVLPMRAAAVAQSDSRGHAVR